MAGKPDLNTRPTSTDQDAFPGSLAEREARAFRPAPEVHRGTALAVVGPDGSAVDASMETLLADLVAEMRALRQGMILAGSCVDVNLD